MHLSVTRAKFLRTIPLQALELGSSHVKADISSVQEAPESSPEKSSSSSPSEYQARPQLRRQTDDHLLLCM